MRAWAVWLHPAVAAAVVSILHDMRRCSAWKTAEHCRSLRHRCEARMQSVGEAQPVVPPARRPGSETPSGLGIAKALGQNALATFPPEAFVEDMVARRFFGRRRIILSRPAGIQHILIDNPGNYRRTTPTMRMLLPLLGRGLLLSDGEDWKHQRRAVAPAFAPRTIPMVARHVAEASRAVIGKLAAQGKRPVDLRAEMQFLAL